MTTEQDSPDKGDDIKRWRTTLIVVAVFAALAAYVLLVDMKREPTTEGETTPTPVPLIEMNIDDVGSLLIQSNSSEQSSLRALRVIHKEAEWRFTDPDASSSPLNVCLASSDGCEADPYVVHLAVEDLCQLSAQRILLQETNDLGQYGLDPVALVLEITTPADGNEEIHIGKLTPDGMSYYVQREGDPRLYLVSQYTVQPFFEWLKDPPYQPPPIPTTTPEPG